MVSHAPNIRGGVSLSVSHKCWRLPSSYMRAHGVQNSNDILHADQTTRCLRKSRPLLTSNNLRYETTRALIGVVCTVYDCSHVFSRKCVFAHNHWITSSLCSCGSIVTLFYCNYDAFCHRFNKVVCMNTKTAHTALYIRVTQL